MHHSRSSPVLGDIRRFLALLLLSIFCGASLGTLDMARTGSPLAEPIGPLGGAIIGLIISPLFAFALWHGPIWLGLSLVVGVSALAELLPILFVPNIDDQVLLSFCAAAVTYPMTCSAFAAWSRLRSDDLRSRPNLCSACGYDLSGLPVPICPECGAGKTVSEP